MLLRLLLCPGPGKELLLLPQQLLLRDAQVLEARALPPPLGRHVLALLQNLLAVLLEVAEERDGGPKFRFTDILSK